MPNALWDLLVLLGSLGAIVLLAAAIPTVVGLVDRARRQIGLFTTILLIVSAVIIALIIYTMTMEKLRQIATLKLIGAPDSKIVGLIVQQALVLGAIAALLSLEPDLTIVGRAPDGDAAHRRDARLHATKSTERPASPIPSTSARQVSPGGTGSAEVIVPVVT